METPNPNALAQEARNVVSQLETIPFDIMYSASLRPQFAFNHLGERIWRERWLNRLDQLLVNANLSPELVQFIRWGIYFGELPSTSIVLELEKLLPSPRLINWEGLERAYLKALSKYPITYVMWPLDTGGIVLQGEPFCLGGEVWYIPKNTSPILLNNNSNAPSVAHYFEQIDRLYPDLLPQTNHTNGAWLAVLVPISLRDGNAEAVQKMVEQCNNRLFLALTALRLASPGAISSPYGVLISDPLFCNIPIVIMEPPYELGDAARMNRLWPVLDIKSTLEMADKWYCTLIKLINMVQIRVPNKTITYQGIMLQRNNPKPDLLIPVSFLDFVLQLFDLTYARGLHEIVIYLWAILEGLLLTSQDNKDTVHNVALRAVALINPLTTNPTEQQDIYNKVRTIANTRHTLAHGREKSPRSIIPTEVWEYHEFVRQVLMCAVEWAINKSNTNQQIEHEDFIDHLSRVILLKSCDEFKKEWERIRP